LTLEALLRFSIEDRFVGDRLSNGDRFSDTGELGSRPCQKFRGEAVLVKDEGDGEVSCLLKLFYRVVSQALSRALLQHTLGKLGEFLRRAMGLNSDSGRLWANDKFLVGDELVLFVPFCTRSGGTCALVRLTTRSWRKGHSLSAPPCWTGALNNSYVSSLSLDHENGEKLWRGMLW